MSHFVKKQLLMNIALLMTSFLSSTSFAINDSCEMIFSLINRMEPLKLTADKIPVLKSYDGPFPAPENVFDNPFKNRIRRLARRIPVDAEGKAALSDGLRSAHDRYAETLTAMQMALHFAETAIAGQIVALGQDFSSGKKGAGEALKILTHLEEYRNRLHQTYQHERDEWLKVFPAVGVGTDQRLPARLKSLDETPIKRSTDTYLSIIEHWRDKFTQSSN